MIRQSVLDRIRPIAQRIILRRLKQGIEWEPTPPEALQAIEEAAVVVVERAPTDAEPALRAMRDIHCLVGLAAPESTAKHFPVVQSTADEIDRLTLAVRSIPRQLAAPETRGQQIKRLRIELAFDQAFAIPKVSRRTVQRAERDRASVEIMNLLLEILREEKERCAK